MSPISAGFSSGLSDKFIVVDENDQVVGESLEFCCNIIIHNCNYIAVYANVG